MIAFEQASVAYSSGTLAVNELTLEVAAGEVVALVGPSGSGKTTALRAVNGLVPLTSGTLRVLDQPLHAAGMVELRRNVGYVIQEAGLLPHWTVAKNIQTVPMLLQWDSKRQQQRARELLREVKLDESLWSRYPEELSGGQRQRVGIARALAGNPQLLLMDEPFGALDPITRQHMRQLVRDLLAQRQVTTLLVTHDLTDALDLAHQLAIMKDGKLVQVGPPKDVLQAPANNWVRSFLRAGLPGTHFSEGTP